MTGAASAALLALLALLAAASGICVLGAAATPLGLAERIAIATVAVLVLDSAVCFLLSLGLGLGPASILLAPALVSVAALLAARRLGVGVLRTWGGSLVGARAHPRAAAGMAGILVAAAILFWLLLSRAMWQDAAGNLVTGYWIPDWAQHLLTASSFSTAQNLPPQDPIMSGTPLYYPFLPDFTSAMLMRLGLPIGPALWFPQVLLGIALVALVVALAGRLGARRSVGVLTVVICFLGGGLGFVGAFHDACVRSGYAPPECSAGYAISHPVDGLRITAATLAALPELVADQPTSYDGMTTAPNSSTTVFSDQRWYTPLFGWWLPQRTLMEGFDVVVAALVLLLAAFERARVRVFDVGVAAVLVGLLPVVHVQSLFALVIIAAGLAAIRWRPAWLLFAGIAAVVAAPRMVQLLLAPHGSLTLGSRYPWLEPGWMSAAVDSSGLDRSISGSNLGVAAIDTLSLPFRGGFWSFWLVNLGIAVPLSAVVAAAALLRRFSSGGVRRLAGRCLELAPAPLVRFLLACLPLFLLCNVVVFQTWDWDNTKLLLYWYLGVALLVSAIAVRLWAGVWRRLLAVLLVGSMVATGALAVLRLLPYTPAAAAVTGPWGVASAADQRLAAAIERDTPANAVFLVSSSTDDLFDPVPLLTGRPVVIFFYPWLWSYGLDYGERLADVQTATAGCGTTSIQRCETILAILRRYQVSYVEVNQTFPAAGAAWWAAQRLPVTASVPGSTVYDVRGLG